MTLRLPTLLASAVRRTFWSPAAVAVRTSPWHVDTLRRGARAHAACASGQGRADAA